VVNRYPRKRPFARNADSPFETLIDDYLFLSSTGDAKRQIAMSPIGLCGRAIANDWRTFLIPQSISSLKFQGSKPLISTTRPLPKLASHDFAC
jgi:hypothetical protein